MTRAEMLLTGVDVDAEVGLEIGPLASAIVPRAPGRQIFYADYMSRDELLASETLRPDISRPDIPEVDYVISPLPSDLGRRFDYVIASHVIEHVPDLLGFLTAVLGWLRGPNSRLILAVPDKRYTFDYLRPLSSIGEVLQAFLERRTSPPFSAIYDTYRYSVELDLGRVWTEEPYQSPLTRTFNPRLGLDWALEARTRHTYRDCHCWVFTYASFLSMMGEINEAGLAPPITVSRHLGPMPGTNEFHVVLSPG